jgi:Uma2 family endonuclease
MKWSEVLASPYLRNLPFKIEMNRFGQILMSPASNYHGTLQNQVARNIEKKHKGGTVINECSIATSDGVKVADVAWASDEFIQEFGFETPYPKAPEICVEIVSPINSKSEIKFKVELYLAKGALEVWIINQEKEIRYYSYEGEIKKSKLIPRFRL